MSKEISIPDDLYSNIEQVCQRLDMTPEKFFTDAAKQALLENMTEEEIIEQINKVCGEVDTSVDPDFYQAQLKVIERSEW